jgi:hypothetical protein
MLAAAVLTSALAFLSAEVPRWERSNHCFSCHNNGDAARALYLARKLGYPVSNATLDATTAWLRRPERWGEIHGAPAASDRALARVQFAAALAEAYRTGATDDTRALRAAAGLLAANQATDGSWTIDTGGLPGAPATYGTALATYMARGVLQTVGTLQYTPAIARATEWIDRAKPASIPDAAALLLAAPSRADCRDLILAAQTSDGGWGPQRDMPAEAFDTALALLALRNAREAVERGRAFLVRTQDRSGAWPETTRPAGGVSYAERISTAGWVTYALLSTGVK